MNKNLKKVIAPVAAAAMVLAVPTGVYAEDGAQEKITFAWIGHRIPTTPDFT